MLAPLSLLFGIGVALRNFFYEKGVLRSIRFDVPTISVGNLSVGGAGKTPHVEYLIRLLKDYINVATLSRGYQRKTKGFLIVSPDADAKTVGDEPLQFRRKFKDIVVTVAESRIFAIPKIMMHDPSTQVILLDDAFQHRQIEPGLNILLTEFSKPFTDDYLLPSGRLREWRSAYKRADVIVVSKCPPMITEAQRLQFIDRLQPLKHQKIFFSYYEYFKPYNIFAPEETIDLTDDLDAILICAIARADYLLNYLDETVNFARVMEYADHHYFNKNDLANLQGQFERMESNNKIILTTEKDAMRLDLHKAFIKEKKLPIYALPVEVKFHFGAEQVFNELVQDYLLNFKS